MHTSPPLDEAAVESLAARVETVLRPGDDDYDEARTVWNAMVDRSPAVVVRPGDTADVVAAVEFAREQQVVLAVKGGGHNVAGNAVCEGGLQLDCSSMAAVTVDPDARTARVGPGVTVGALDAATVPHRLVVPAGIISATGVAGLTLGGGWGWLSRSLGLTIDSLRSAEVVTADGRVLVASAADHADLFWAVRGGGGNVGVVTSFEFDLHPLDQTVLAGVLLYPFEDAREVLRYHREFTQGAPDALCCYASVRTAPSLPVVPEALHGRLVTALYLCYAGDVAAGEQVIRPLRGELTPVADLVEPRAYVDFQRLFDDVYPPGFRNYWKSGFVAEGLSDAAIDTVVERAATVTSPYTSVVVEHLGGAISTVPPDATAYAHRTAGYAFNVFTRWADATEDERHVRWAQSFFEAIAPLLGDGVYVNFLDREPADRVRAAFGDNYERLVAVKTRYDPDNVFRVNQNVEPAA
jgi:FAD/FMN-containing dehydrogenase